MHRSFVGYMLEDVVVERDLRGTICDIEKRLADLVYASGFDSFVEVRSNSIQGTFLKKASVVVEICIGICHERTVDAERL